MIGIGHESRGLYHLEIGARELACVSSTLRNLHCCFGHPRKFLRN